MTATTARKHPTTEKPSPIERVVDVLERMSPAIPAGGPTASLTVSLGDANHNGTADVIVSATVFGRTITSPAFDLPLMQGLQLVTQLHQRLLSLLGGDRSSRASKLSAPFGYEA
jgi:hypothetical protein